MKGLLTKEYYLTLKTYKSYLFIIIPFLLVSFVASGNGLNFFMFYPILMIGMIPQNLLTNDEKSRWNIYCAALPYTRSQMVSSKYILTFLLTLSITLVCIIMQLLRLTIDSNLTAEAIHYHVSALLSYFSAGIICPSITMPIMYKFGVEKGRFIYIGVIILICAFISGVTIKNTTAVFTTPISEELLFSMIEVLTAVALFRLSWRLSIAFFKKREF